MSLKKSLRIIFTKKAQVPLERTGQASLEYFILLAVIGGLILTVGGTFLEQTRQTSQDLFTTAVGRILR